jgi:hypothetical protein
VIVVPTALLEVEEPARDDGFQSSASARRKPPAGHGSGGSSGLWIGLGAAIFALVLAASGVVLWATGVFSSAQKSGQQNSQALNTQQKSPESNKQPVQPAPPESKPAPQRPEEPPKVPTVVPDPPKGAPKQPQKQPEEKRREEPYELKGDRLGMSLQDFKTKYRHKLQGDPREAPFTSDQREAAARESKPLSTLGEEPWHPKANVVNARITFPFEDYMANNHTPTLAGVKTDLHFYRFVDDRLYRIEYVFPQSGFSEVQEAMVATYGKPRDITTKEYQNSFGAKFTGKVCTWDNAVSGIILMERSVDLKTSLLMFVHHELDKVVEARRVKFRKPPGL